MAYIYPEELLNHLKKRWSKRTGGSRELAPLPDDDIVIKLLEVCYHASFLTEEQRGLAFRVIFASKNELNEVFKRHANISPRTRIIQFKKTRPFSMRLSKKHLSFCI